MHPSLTTASTVQPTRMERVPISRRSSPSGGPNETDAKRQHITGREDGRRQKERGLPQQTPYFKVHELTLRGFCLLRGRGARLARLRFVRRLPGGLRFLLGRELLLDLGRDRGHVHLVELGGFSQGFRGFVGAVRRLQNGDCHQNAADCALVGLAKKGREQLGRGVSGCRWPCRCREGER